MKYFEFVKTLNHLIFESKIQSSLHYKNEIIHLLENNSIYINFNKTNFQSIDEAKNGIDTKEFEKNIIEEFYNSIPKNKIINAINEHHNVKITDTMLEYYIDAAKQKIFSIDPVVAIVRKLSMTESFTESFTESINAYNKLDFILNDGSIVLISENTFNKMTNYLNYKYNIIEYTRQSIKNFMKIVEQVNYDDKSIIQE